MIPASLNICGGGLWGGLLAYRLHTLKPEQPFILYERENTFGGNHTWCFHESDVGKDSLSWLKPFIVKSWDAYEVKFPAFSRKIESRYHCINSERFHEVLSSTLPKSKVALNSTCPQTDFLDARGSTDFGPQVGYQKFYGLHLALKHPHNLSSPVIMDSTVPQLDGFHFFYYLPFSESEILVESTYYSNDPLMEKEEIKKVILTEIHRKGWRPESIIREEEGVLPLPLQDIILTSQENPNLAGMLHDTTGFSLPDAVRVIDQICTLKELSLEEIRKVIASYKNSRQINRRYYQFLNRMMFEAIPHERYKVLQHFYKLPEELIQRFYRGDTTHFDKLRILLGKPPVPVSIALNALKPRSLV